MFKVILANKELHIKINLKKTDESELTVLVKRVNSSIEIAKQYYNSKGIKLRRNIDKMLYKYDSKESSLSELAKKEM